ncbi:MAG: C69 family dipeptidase [Deltaproteobacteria bacterium]|nr:C69 family dipeptidase [Deltaproteobacteria bacterium]MBN2846301.1 C69 family dipeptidase [Deltaproteobacteria bacterium]
MGVNEKGLAIGNEAVFTKDPYEKGKALTGMDLLRLGLERASHAREAVEVIASLLAEYGQGGNCGFQHKFFYHNSFLMADPDEAWVLETSDRHWAAKKVDGVYTISNGITIGSDWDMASPDLVNNAVKKGWCKNPEDFHFARCYSDFLFTTFSDCRKRRSKTIESLNAKKGGLTVHDFIATLRDHGEQSPEKGITGSAVCMHAGFGPIRGSQTTGSMVSSLHRDYPTHFFTGTAAPCTGIFKPLWVDATLPDMGPVPSGTYDDASLYWRHEVLHRKVLRDFSASLKTYQPERDELESEFVRGGLKYATESSKIRALFSERCFNEAGKAEKRWFKGISAVKAKRKPPLLYRTAWRGFNRKAKMGEFV